MKSEKSVFKASTNISNFIKFIEFIKDLSNLNTTVFIIIDDEEITLFSAVGENLNIMYAIKTYIFNKNEIFTEYTNLQNNIVFILKDSKKFYNSLNTFAKYTSNYINNDKILFEIYHNQQVCEQMIIKNSKSKEVFPSVRINNNMDKIEKNDIKNLLNVDNAQFNFKLYKKDFEYIKSKLNIETDNDVLYININDNTLSISETKWEHILDNINYENTSISFPKKFFKALTFSHDEEFITVYHNSGILIFKSKKAYLCVAEEIG